GENLKASEKGTILKENIKIIKEVLKKDVSIGDLVPYKITVQSTDKNRIISELSIKDILPTGFKYAEGSGKIDGKKAIVLKNGRELTFKNIILNRDKKVQLIYILRVGTGVIPGVYKNTAWVERYKKKVSRIAEASVTVENDPLFSSTVILGKVFNDRDFDGWQDDATSKRIKVETLDNLGNYKNTKKIISLGSLRGRESELDTPKIFQIKREVKNPYLISSLKITDKNGTIILLNNDGTINEDFNRSKEKGITCEKLKVMRKIVEKDNKYYEILKITNLGINEEGIPGVRLATVNGTVMETDSFGRYHLDGIDDVPERGENFIIKVDKATLPFDSKFTTENPRVQRIGKVMAKFNFGVHLPKEIIRKKEVIEKINLGSIYFSTDKSNIRKDQRENLMKIIENLKKYSRGTIYISGNTDSRASNEYNRKLGLRRGNSIKKELLKVVDKNKVLKIHISETLPVGGKN
uniref:OmpA family protein n=1 Tax=uncultured Cetobacterium sp. TaxID=527638 RepID=UPI00261B23D6